LGVLINRKRMVRDKIHWRRVSSFALIFMQLGPNWRVHEQSAKFWQP
jgi:hypothetical protein